MRRRRPPLDPAISPESSAGGAGRDGLGRDVVLVVRLPDRPGALGAVASRIGALGGNITDVSVADRSGDGWVVDTFSVRLPAGAAVIDLLHAEIAEVDGAGVDHWYEVRSSL